MSVRDPLPRQIGGVPRRARLDLIEPAERAICVAQSAVEGMPADERLTRAGVLLAKARDLVADYLEGVELAEESPEAELARLRGLLTDAHTTMGSSIHDLVAMQARIADGIRCR